MKQFTPDQLTQLLADHTPPCLSLYLPTHRSHPENQKDPIVYRNLLKEMDSSLRQKYSTNQVRSLVDKFQALADDRAFWNHRTDGLVVLGSADSFQVFDLQRSVPELVVVADSFHIKPLLRILQSADRYQILSLTREEAKLYEGDRDSLDPIEMPNVPHTLTEALGAELTEPHLTVASYGKGSTAGGQGAPAMHHGHGSRKEEVGIDTERFFRVIDRGVRDHHSRPSGLPLLLAALPEYHAQFHKISHNTLLMAEGIASNPESLDLNQLRVEAWRVAEPHYQKRLAKMADDYQLAYSRQQASDNLAAVAEAAIAGRVGVLLVEADRQIPGKIDQATGKLQSSDLADPEVDDALDDLAELVLRMKGEVVVVSTKQMPTTTGVAASYRF